MCDILWRHKIVFQVFAQLGISFFKFFFSFSFRKEKCVMCNLNSKGGLTIKLLNLDLF